MQLESEGAQSEGSQRRRNDAESLNKQTAPLQIALSHSHGPPDLQQREENLDPVHDAALGSLSRKHILQQLLHALLPAGTQTACHFFFIATNIFTE